MVPSFLRPHVERLEKSSTGSRLIKGAFWSVSGALVSRALAIASAIVVARVTGKSGFGELGVIQSTVGMFQVFAGFGLGITATKYVAQYRTTDVEKAGRIIGLSTLVALGTGSAMALTLMVSAHWLAQNSLASPELTGPLRISALMLLLGALTGAQTGVLSAFEEFKTIARITLIAGLANFPLMVGGVYLAGVKGAVWALVAAMGVNCLLNHFALRHTLRIAGVPPRFSAFTDELKVLWRFSVPAVGGAIMIAPVLWLCNAMLVNQPGGYGEMGIYNAANQWRTAIMFLPATVEVMILPILSNLRGEGNWTAYRKVLLYNVAFSAGIALIAALVVYGLSPLILKSYGHGFESGRLVILILGLSAVLTAITSASGPFMASEDRMWSGMILNLVWAVTLLSSTWFLIKRGALGLALAYLIAYAVHLVTVSCFAYYMLSNRQSSLAAMPGPSSSVTQAGSS